MNHRDYLPRLNIAYFSESISCLEQAVNIFLEIGRLSMAARYYKVQPQTTLSVTLSHLRLLSDLNTSVFILIALYVTIMNQIIMDAINLKFMFIKG